MKEPEFSNGIESELAVLSKYFEEAIQKEEALEAEIASVLDPLAEDVGEKKGKKEE